MNNYLQLLGENINDVIFDKVLDIYEKDISNLEKKINTINNKIHLYEKIASR